MRFTANDQAHWRQWSAAELPSSAAWSLGKEKKNE